MAKKKSQKSLKRWGDQDWGYVSEGDEKKPKKKRGRYLPKSVRRSLTPGQKAATNRKKRKAGGVGSRAKYSKKVAKKVSAVSKLMKYVDIQKDNGVLDYLFTTPSKVRERYKQARKEGYSIPDANRLANPAGTYDDPTTPTGLVFPKLKRPTFITDPLAKITGAQDKATREKATRIFREVDSQEVDRDTGGATKRFKGYRGPVDIPIKRLRRKDAPVPDWTGYSDSTGQVNI